MSSKILNFDQIFENCSLALMLNLGNQLGLIDWLKRNACGSDSGRSADDIAKETKLKQRYVLEWLHGMVAGGALETDEEGESFWMTPEMSRKLSESTLGFMNIFQLLNSLSDNVKTCFQATGPKGLEYDEYGARFFQIAGEMASEEHRKFILPFFLPLVPGLEAKLSRGGAQVLEIGCGVGTPTMEFAAKFPDSNFVGTDISELAVQQALEASDGQKNVHFESVDATEMPESWTDRFDFVMAFGAIHDIPNAQKALDEIFRVLKPDSYFAMMEAYATGNPAQDRDQVPLAVVHYMLSTFHCLPTSANIDGSLALGNMWGEKRAREMLRNVGFQQIQVFPAPPKNFHMLCLSLKSGNQKTQLC